MCNSCFWRPRWWTSQQKYSRIAFHLCWMAYTSQTPSAHRWHTWVAWPINKRTRDADSQICTAYLFVLWHRRATSRGGSTSTPPSSETCQLHGFHCSLDFQEKGVFQLDHVQNSRTRWLCANNTYIWNHRFVLNSAGKLSQYSQRHSAWLNDIL